jgi:GNAT superfamily N-acetyltransferase
MLPEYRRQGIITLLNRQVEKRMRTLEIARLAGRVVVDKAVARQFYRRENYRDHFVSVSRQIKP